MFVLGASLELKFSWIQMILEALLKLIVVHVENLFNQITI